MATATETAVPADVRHARHRLITDSRVGYEAVFVEERPTPREPPPATVADSGGVGGTWSGSFSVSVRSWSTAPPIARS